MKLSRITVYVPFQVLNRVTDAYAALLGSEPATSHDERGKLIELTDDAGFTIELRPVSLGAGQELTTARLEFRGDGAVAAAERLHAVTGGVQAHPLGGSRAEIAGVSVRLVGPSEEPR